MKEDIQREMHAIVSLLSDVQQKVQGLVVKVWNEGQIENKVKDKIEKAESYLEKELAATEAFFGKELTAVLKDLLKHRDKTNVEKLEEIQKRQDQAIKVIEPVKPIKPVKSCSAYFSEKVDGNTITVTNPSVDYVRAKILEVGSKIGSVWFHKREDNSLRKMCYRLHVTNPSVVKAPAAKDKTIGVRLPLRKDVDRGNNQITVYDVNKVVRDIDGNIIGRGSYRTVPLERVTRIVSNGKTYNITYPVNYPDAYPWKQ